MKRTFNKRRSKSYPRNPKTIGDIGDIPQKYKNTLDGKEFLIYDSWNDEEDDEPPQNRILVFSTRQFLKRLTQSLIVNLDGTFETSPDIFTQVFTIHGEYGGEVFPFVFALLPDKSEASYRTVLQAVVDKCRDMRIASPKPVTVISDMEVGIINATKTIFSDAEIRLCLFHLRQAAWRHLQEGGLQVAHRNPEDDSIRNAFREVVGLAFVPVDDVKEACEVVIDNLPVRMADFGDYFEKTYVIGHRNRRTRRTVPPRYPPALWNHYIAAVENQPRTNNATEAWHNRFQTIVGKSHPSLYKLIGEFQKEAADVKVMMEELDGLCWQRGVDGEGGPSCNISDAQKESCQNVQGSANRSCWAKKWDEDQLG
ncbi:uncharacterized protein LOC113215949 [Frankliniella occidentalis]|uniref:Uncharacterized protein LOC113215949 n=1 Tax=Frankliniella occidentalis TaxID=133901 RepID=A0A9C6U5U6_FRAOC|nr:uncharacterized protein LOC113215949 [Frankliniella occidentalis]